MTMQQTDGAVRPAGRPRSEKAEKAIIEAALDILGEGSGVSELSIEAIAARAGVGKTTIYRRWTNKEDLVVDALASLKPPIAPLKGVSVRDDLVDYLQVVQSESSHVRTRCIMNIAMSQSDRHPRVAERFHEIAIKPRQEMLSAVLERGMANGELRADLDVPMAMAILSGTMMWRTKWAEEALPVNLAEQIVDEVLRGFRPR